MFSLKSEIAIIGAGRVSYSLANALVKSDFKVSSIISKRISSAKYFAKKYKIKNYSSDLNSLSPDVTIFFLAVPDSQILPVAQEIAKLNLDFKKSLFIHLSGAEDISPLNILKRKGTCTASFHIMQTFSERKTIDLKHSYASVETNNKKAADFLFRFAKKLNLYPFKISSKKKVYYHIAGVYASNFLVANQFYTEQLFGKAKRGMNYKKIFDPIIKKTFENIEKHNVLNAISGPVERGDIKTVRRHIGALKKDKTLRSNYICQSLTLLEVIRKRDKGLSALHRNLKNYLVELL